MRFSFAPMALASAVLLSAFGSLAQASTFEDDVDGLSESQLETTVEFAFDNSLFFLFHEMGHMLISEFDLPVLGREEDAADTLATLTLLEMDDPLFDKALFDSVVGWKMSFEAGEEPNLWDTYSLDRQRAYHMVCMMVGKSASKFQQAADDLGMPQDRREECVAEYNKTHDSWFGLLEEHVRQRGKEPSFEISYQAPEDESLSDYADLVKTSSLLEIVEKVAAIYKLDDGIKLVAAECGEPNAYWSADDRELTFCYELSQWYTRSMAATFLENKDSSVEE